MPATLCVLYEKISQCNVDEWDELVRASRSDMLMSHGFIAAAEEAVEDQARFMHAVAYDDRRAVACGSFCAFPIDFNLYGPSLHRLYEAVALSSTHRLELLALSFFHKLARRLPGRVGLTLVYASDRVAAFNWNLFHANVYHFLFAGLNYELNGSMDLGKAGYVVWFMQIQLRIVGPFSCSRSYLIS
jgi:Acetyltransferase (GNAT) domain